MARMSARAPEPQPLAGVRIAVTRAGERGSPLAAALRAAALAITAADTSPQVKTLARAEARRLQATALLALDQAAEAERVPPSKMAISPK